MSKQLCLKWNNHTSNLLEFFGSLISTEVFADVTLACEGLSLKAHKIVLSACSPFFKNLFLENPSKHPIVIMKDIRFCDLKALLKFIYSGEVSVSHDQLLSFLLTAETLKVKGLEKVTAENRHALGIGKQKNVIQPPVPTPTSPSLSQPAKKITRSPLSGKSKRAGLRKRPLVSSERSDEEGISAKLKGKVSPDVEELSNDSVLDFASDISSGTGPSSIFMVSLHSLDDEKNSPKSRSSVPKHPKISSDVNESDVEPSNLLEQTVVVENASPTKKSFKRTPFSSVSGLDISRDTLGSTDFSQIIVPDTNLLSDSNIQPPDSPPDIKPEIISLGDMPISPIAGPSHSSGRSTINMDHSNDSLKSVSSNSKVHKSMAKKRVSKRKKQSEEILSVPAVKKEPWKQILHMCSDCSYTNSNIEELISHIEYHKKTATQCEFCKIDFTKLLDSEHMPMDDEHAVECDICNHCFCSKMALLTHKLLHHY